MSGKSLQYMCCSLLLLFSIGHTVSKRVLIGSPVRRDSVILQEFLYSLEHLKQDTFSADYYFVDDNDDPQSSALLYDFATRHEHCLIIREIDTKTSFVCDDTMHHWNDALIERVTRFKNDMITYAIQHEYDYLFLIDSDLLLYPETIEHLITTEKDIISEVFWTKWQPNTDPLPQVWQYDVYGLGAEFVERLKHPGVYEVGGLGACTLITRKALQSGVNFNRLHNVSFWGEDRHFCIRAVALGFNLYVDTHFPAYHFYRKAELEGV